MHDVSERSRKRIVVAQVTVAMAPRAIRNVRGRWAMATAAKSKTSKSSSAKAAPSAPRAGRAPSAPKAAGKGKAAAPDDMLPDAQPATATAASMDDGEARAPRSLSPRGAKNG